ncbi:MAG: 2OG-Fe(II) oxygenase [Thalassotalea sp.]|nr:2OG-Fe(II) oxygenase [Thalassotalea sp.]
MHLRLEKFDIASLITQFQSEGVVRLDNILLENDVQRILEYYSEQVEFTNAFYADGHSCEASDAQINALEHERKHHLHSTIHSLAAQGIGFFYGRKKINKADSDPISKLLYQLNKPETLQFITKLSGVGRLSYADGQATRFRAGDFLTRHIDNVKGETREVAYVVGFTRQWHPDWGGLLQFFEKDGTPTNSYAPSYNSLTLFDVNKVHSVTSVTPFAPKNRYSLTGWYRR